MREAYLVNDSQSAVTISLYEKEEVPVPPIMAPKKCELLPGEELTLGVDLDSDRVRFYESYGPVNVRLGFREPKDGVPESEEVEGVYPAVLHDIRGHISDLEIVTGYNVIAKKYSDRDYIKVAIKASSLHEHTNGAGVKGYWVGFAVEAPESAVFMRTGFAQGQNDLSLGEMAELEKNVTPNGSKGVAFYTNLSQEIPYLWGIVEWFDIEGTSLGDPVEYYMDISNILLAPNVASVDNAVAKVGSTYFTSVKGAIENIGKRESVVLLKDIVLSDTLKIVENKDFSINLNGKTLKGDLLVSGSLRIYDNSLKYGLYKGSVTIEKGTVDILNGEYSIQWILQDENNCTVSISGGFFDEKIPAEYCASGFAPLEVEGKFTVGRAVATANGIGYTTLAEAIKAGGYVTLLSGVSVHEGITIEASQDVVLDLNGKTLTLKREDNYSLVVKGHLTIAGEGNVIAKGPYAIGTSTSCVGGLTINGGNFDASECIYLFGGFAGKIEIHGGTFKSSYCVLNSFDKYNCHAEIYDGVFVLEGATDETAALLLGINIDVFGGTFSEEIPEEYCAEGYKLIKNANGDYLVKAIQ